IDFAGLFGGLFVDLPGLVPGLVVGAPGHAASFILEVIRMPANEFILLAGMRQHRRNGSSSREGQDAGQQWLLLERPRYRASHLIGPMTPAAAEMRSRAGDAAGAARHHVSNPVPGVRRPFSSAVERIAGLVPELLHSLPGFVDEAAEQLAGLILEVADPAARSVGLGAVLAPGVVHELAVPVARFVGRVADPLQTG